MIHDGPGDTEVRRIEAGRSRRVAGYRIMVSRSGILHAYDASAGTDTPPLCRHEAIDWMETRPMFHGFLNHKMACRNCLKRLVGRVGMRVKR